MANHSAPKRRRFTKPAIMVGVAGSLAIALGMGASLSGYVATITNTTNTAASATMAITETGPGSTAGSTGTCNSYDGTTSCGTINKYGGTGTPLAPGGSQTVTVAFKNTGAVPVSSGLITAAACQATVTTAVGAKTPTTPNTDRGNLCAQLNIAVYPGTTQGTALNQIYNGSAAAFTSGNLNNISAISTLAPGATVNYTFVVSLPSSSDNNMVQGQQISQQLTWTFNQ